MKVSLFSTAKKTDSSQSTSASERSANTHQQTQWHALFRTWAGCSLTEVAPQTMLAPGKCRVG